MLDRLGPDAASVERITVHTPDLDDVFFALTGHPQEGRENPS
jgi:ABC-2 type transport system ATP-binding protein